MSLYTVGNWTVDEEISPASSTAITPSVATVTRAEYSAKSNDGTTAVIVNNTGSGLSVPEQLRFGATSVKNVYTGSDVPMAQQLPLKTGVRLLQEIRLNLKATNSVNGAEVQIPQRAWIVYETPQTDIVTSTAVEYTMKRLLGAAIMGVSGHTFADRIMAMARGDLDPSQAI
jgi:uncharacterized protein involved in outer membrane biogenesis